MQDAPNSIAIAEGRQRDLHARLRRAYLAWVDMYVSRGQWRVMTFCYLALLPVLVLFGYVRVLPTINAFILSVYKWELIDPIRPFVGLDNYWGLLEDENFLLALKNTLIFSPSVVVASTLLSLPLALFLARKGKLSVVYQTIYFLPVITPLVPVSIAWKWIYDYNYGLLNYGLSLVGLPAVAWLTDADIALWALVIMSVWKHLGQNLVFFLVGIRNIPSVYLEAAMIDGADAWQQFRYITLPLLRPILLFVVVTSTINAFTVFTQVYVMTLGSQAAPGQAVRVIALDIYYNAFQYLHMGYASAESVLLFIMVLAFTIIQFRLARSQKEGLDG
ncbi:MAG: sugar ABC transporter permease [Proteobacteria bacterium]|nr:sugar ABC transporter permease [Pseudomonadota bacterium]